ncbi:MAG: ATP-binding protein [Deltaproteobacteria bacterium]|nr:ATP-binding protein [Deltaproteobacteria bacterium]
MDTLRLPAQLESLERFRLFMLHKVEQWGLSSSMVLKLELVLEEVLTNVVKYAYRGTAGEVELGCRLTGSELVVVICDRGVEFNPLAKPPPDTSEDIESRQIGGLGIHMVRHMVDRLEYRREGDTNVLTITLAVTQP